MNAAESKVLKKGNRVYWRGDVTDSGIITEMSWDAVAIAGHARGPASPITAYCPIKAYYCVGILCSVGVLLLALSGHSRVADECPLLGGKADITPIRVHVCF
jgi:hypothetical protein